MGIKHDRVGKTFGMLAAVSTHCWLISGRPPTQFLGAALYPLVCVAPGVVPRAQYKQELMRKAMLEQEVRPFAHAALVWVHQSASGAHP